MTDQIVTEISRQRERPTTSESKPRCWHQTRHPGFSGRSPWPCWWTPKYKIQT